MKVLCDKKKCKSNYDAIVKASRKEYLHFTTYIAVKFSGVKFSCV